MVPESLLGHQVWCLEYLLSLAAEPVESGVILHCDYATVLTNEVVVHESSNEMVLEDNHFQVESLSAPLVLIRSSERVG